MMKKLVLALLAGLVFGIGLGISGMTKPAKVIGFLDVGGAWDPSLAFVMAGAIGVHLAAVRLAKRRAQTLLGGSFAWPEPSAVDGSLLAGAALFGVGWGLGGFCPGPAITSAASGNGAAIVFLVAMAVGMVTRHATRRASTP